MYVLGISAYYHDSAATLIKSGEIVAAAQEERFSRKKHDPSFPRKAIEYCLQEARITLDQIAAITFYDKPLIKFERILETHLSYAPRGLISFLKSMPLWLNEKLFLKSLLKKELAALSKLKAKDLPQILFTEHHQSHAASAFYPSPFSKAAVLCLDGVGEWATTSVWLGEGNRLNPVWEIQFPHSLGLLYSAFTAFAGFKVNSGEYKLMGLAPYGKPCYVEKIKNHLIDIKEDGTFRLNMDYFNYPVGLQMTNKSFQNLFEGPPRKPESPVTPREMDLACSIQAVTEEIILKLARTIQRELKVDSLCLAGGVALNCVANGRLLREKIFKDIWIQPAAGDAGGSLGAALATWYQYFDKERPLSLDSRDRMKGAFLGPSYSNQQVEKELKSLGADFQIWDEKELVQEVSKLLQEGNVIGWFQGRMEFGPRSLGARSILADARNPQMQSQLNLKIKFRESFRPFAPAVLAEDVEQYFDLDRPSPYMLLVAPVERKRRLDLSEDQKSLVGIEKLKVQRSEIPAVTHVDFSARVQTVHQETNSKLAQLLRQFKADTGCSVLVNTSFNVRGEPVVCSVADAYRCFLRTDMDYLVLENCLLSKKRQPQRKLDLNWMKEFELD